MKKYDVLAIGELNPDIILTGLKSLPTVGREIIAESFSMALGSSTAICASGMARLGLGTGFIGKIGRDKFGDFVIEEIKKNGIDTNMIIVDENIKTGITISLSMAKDRALVTYLGSIEVLALEDIDMELIKNTRHIHIGSYYLQNRLRPGIPELFASAKENGVSTSLDAGWDDTQQWNGDIFKALKFTDIFMPNESEALNITKKDNVRDAVEALSKHSKIVVVKCGPKGAVGKWGDQVVEQETFDLEPVDTTGAGDSFNAGFIYGFLNGYGLEKCMAYGNACGSISITRIGGASSCATLSEIEELLNRNM